MPAVELSEESIKHLAEAIGVSSSIKGSAAEVELTREEENLGAGHIHEGKYVVMTDSLRGVMAGVLVRVENGRALVRDMRSAHYCKTKEGAEGVAGLAIAGPQEGSKIQPAIPGLSDVGPVARIMPCSEVAFLAWIGSKWG